MPFAVKVSVQEDLHRLEKDGVLVKLDHSEWAAPIVTVPKKDGKIRICGDYKVTVNPILEVDQYPLPHPTDLFATLAGGKYFSKLNLSQAYNQIQVDAESQKFLAINTHRGLYRYTRLPFGVASVPAIFQKSMDIFLQGIGNVICYIDDILISGKTEEEHLKTLSQVLSRLQKYGVHMKRSKRFFLRECVQYLGHSIDANGVHMKRSKRFFLRECVGAFY